ncbi:phage tail assembly chaperone [Achromobacter ruhlandii]|uniref:phage tail assembly chaperone n=1 Tax=Achromobacter ruhlandii TaxID=72557 RepID=UPI0007BF7C41|nr:phage tail assembly chaperone [Achromobacter ruhlandii]
MTFIIKGNPVIEAKVTITGQGRTQTLELAFRHKTGDEYRALMAKVEKGKLSTDALLLELIERWNADMPLDEAGLVALRQHQPGADLAIVQAYNRALQVELGNG